MGVMELAGRIFDVAARAENISDQIRELLPEITDAGRLVYWKRVLRVAALCHDLGHLPFSHAAEHELLPSGWDHEELTRHIVTSTEFKQLLEQMTPPVRADDVVKLALGPKKAKVKLTTWETILSEIIVGDAFGADRMDYLLRDSHHAGVAYGRLDHYRLIDTLRILPLPPSDPTGGESAPALGVEEGGIHSAEALMLARYFMFSQLYLHPIRRIYDIHLKDFLKEWLPGNVFSTDVPVHLSLTDNEVTAAFAAAARDESLPGHDAARRIVCRDHFRLLYQRHPDDVKINPECGKAVYNQARARFSDAQLRWDRYPGKGGAPDFPVQTRDGRLASSLAISDTLRKLPALSTDFVFVDRSIEKEARKWLRENRSAIIKPATERDL